MSGPRRRARVRVHAWRLAVFVATTGCWELSVALGVVNPFWVSSPSRIWGALVAAALSGDLLYHAWASFFESVVGFVAGAVAGILMGFVLARWPGLGEVLDPYLTALNSLPRVALAPLFILWFGIGSASKIVVAFTLVVFILLVNTLAGARSVDPDLQVVARLLGATRRQLFVKVILPAAAPTIFAGLRLGLVYALLGAVVGEMLAATKGLGYLLTFYAGSFNVAGLMAMLLVLALLATGLNEIMRMLERRVLRWNELQQ